MSDASRRPTYQPAYKPEWQRALVILTGTVLAAVLVGVLVLAKSVLIPIALAIFLSFILSPVASFLERVRVRRVGLGRTLSVVLTTGTAFVITVGVAWVITDQLSQLVKSLPDYRSQIMTKVNSVRGMVTSADNARLTEFFDAVRSALEGNPVDLIPTVAGPESRLGLAALVGGFAQEPLAPPRPTQTQFVVAPTKSWMSSLNEYGNPVAEVLGQAALTFILAVFMLLKREDLRNRFIRLIGAGRITTTTKAVDDASRRVSRYLLTQLLLNTAFAIVITLGLLVAGIEYAVLWGFISLVMRYVPYIGTWLGVLPPLVFTIAVYDGWYEPTFVFVLFIGLELICNNVFEPRLYGRSLGLSEVAQLVAAAVWAYLWGPIGLVLSGPLTTCLLLLGKYVPRLEFLWVLLGDEPALEVKARFYQRIAARDEDEASRVLYEDATRNGSEEAFDRVVVPALASMKQDAEVGDLTPDELAYCLNNVREIAEDFVEYRRSVAAPADVAAGLPPRVRILACPAKDAVDRVAVELLALTLDPLRWEVEVSAVETLTSELIDRIAADPPQVVCIGTLPPGGLSHTRYVCKRLRAKFPDIKIVIGRWSAAKDAEEAARFDESGADSVEWTLVETRNHLNAWHPALGAAAEAAAGAANVAKKPAAERAVGTGTA